MADRLHYSTPLVIRQKTRLDSGLIPVPTCVGNGRPERTVNDHIDVRDKLAEVLRKTDAGVSFFEGSQHLHTPRGRSR